MCKSHSLKHSQDVPEEMHLCPVPEKSLEIPGVAGAVLMPTIIAMLSECNVLATTQHNSLHQSLKHLEVSLPSIVQGQVSVRC